MLIQLFPLTIIQLLVYWWTPLQRLNVACLSLSTRSHPRLTCASITGNLIVFGLYHICTDGRRNVSRKGKNVSVFAYQTCRYNSTTALNFGLFSSYQLNAHFLYSVTIYMLHYNPQHVSSSTLLVFRRTNCIITASGIVTLCKRPYSMSVESGVRSQPAYCTAVYIEWRYQML